QARRPSGVLRRAVVLQLGGFEWAGVGSLDRVLRFDMHLLGAGGRDLGLLARLRDLLPGRYAFGLTGRGPNGSVLPAGRYSLRLLAFPAAGGRAVGRSVVFTVR